MQELHEILSAMVAQKEKVRDRRELLLDMGGARRQGGQPASSPCKLDEVGDAAAVGSTGSQLRFVAPRRFAELGSIPTTKRDSIAVGVLAKRSGEVINNVPMVKHVTFFESIKLRDKPSPIQKMVSTPLVVHGHPVGVAEISRKGETAREAGPDFTPADLKHAQESSTGSPLSGGGASPGY